MEKTIICIMGIPASGKTVFCNAVKNKICSGNHSILVCHICYDQLFSIEEQKHLVQSMAMKESRQQIAELLEMLLGRPESNEEFEQMKHKVLEFNQMTAAQLNSNPVAFLIDDNLYYRSMRYKFVQIARKYKTGFGEIFLNNQADVALQWNAKREAAVSHDVILTMASKLEEPLPLENNWEMDAMVLSSETALDNATLDASIALIIKSFESPLSEAPDDTVQKELSKLTTSTSTIHQADIILRKLIGEKIKQHLETKIETEGAELYRKALLNARLLVIEELKAGKLEVTNETLCISNEGNAIQGKMKQLLHDRFKVHLEHYVSTDT